MIPMPFMRDATIKDYDFISSLILREAANGHFARNLLDPGASAGLELEITSVLTHKLRPNGCVGYAFIWGFMGKPVGFVATSALGGNNGNELWLAAVAPEYRGRGVGQEMIDAVLLQFRQQGVGLMARCAPESEAMFHILSSRGFLIDAVLEKGTRQLASPW